jgi:uncharacterized lipoprotein YehR (DUF1307 family)
MRRITIVALVLAIALAACGSKPRTYNYYDYDSGAAVRVTCDNSWGNGLDKDSCAIIILDDGR